MKDNEATRQRELLHTAFDALGREFGAVKGTVDNVQQDVAEMKNELSDQQKKIVAYEADRPVAIAALRNVEELTAFMEAVKKQETYDKGFWAAFKLIGAKTWVMAGVVGTVLFTIFVHYGMPYIVELLQRPS
jgi:hypothetical protein